MTATWRTCAGTWMLMATAGCGLVAGIDDRAPAPGSTAHGGNGGSTGWGGSGGTGTAGGPVGGASATAGAALLVAVENLDPNGSAGDILACPLSTGEAATCSLLGVSGTPRQPFALGWVPPNLVVLAGRTTVVAVDLVSQLVAWTFDLGAQLHPVDVFALEGPDADGTIVAVAYEQLGNSEIRYLHAFDATGQQPVHSWELNNGSLPLGLSWIGMTEQPDAPTHLWALNANAGVALREVDPFTLQSVGTDVTTSRILRSVYALHDGSRSRVAWAGGTDHEGLYFLSQQGTVAGPIQCSVQGAPCDFEHAVPDPRSDGSYLGLCGHSSVVRQVVRLEVGSSLTTACEIVYDGALLGETKRLARMAVKR